MFTHGPREGSTDSDCEVCAPGSFSDAMGVAACAPCPNGTASSVVGAVSNATCAACGGLSYSLHPGAAECTQCGDGANDIANGTSAAATPSVTTQAELPQVVIDVCTQLGAHLSSDAPRRGMRGARTATLAAAALGLVHGLVALTLPAASRRARPHG